MPLFKRQKIDAKILVATLTKNTEVEESVFVIDGKKVSWILSPILDFHQVQNFQLKESMLMETTNREMLNGHLMTNSIEIDAALGGWILAMDSACRWQMPPELPELAYQQYGFVSKPVGPEKN